MPAAFSYIAKLVDGRTINGSLEADSQKSVVDALHAKGLIVIQVKRLKAHTATSGGIRLDDLAIFSRQLATLVDAGIPIIGGLDALADQLENRALRAVVIKVREAVDGGESLTSAIAKQSAAFSPLFVNMIRAGEVSGRLAEVLSRLSTYFEKSAALQRKIRAALVYPTIVILMAMAITALLMLKVIPSFKEIFNTLGAQLPLPTQILLAVSDVMQKGFLPGLLLMGAGSFLFRAVLRTPRGRLQFDRVVLKIGIVGPLVRKVAIARFARTLSTLIQSGVQILEALEIVSETSGNRVVSEAILKVKTSIREGQNISGPLAASKVFPPMVVRMIAVGEQTGRLDEMLTKVAEFYEEQVDTAVAGLTSAIEPIIIGVLGVVVGSIVISIFLPIFKVTELIGH